MGILKTSKEKLGLRELLALGIGGMIGGGIFSVLGISVSFAGNGAPFSFLIDLLIALAAGYHYVKLALTFRDDGASYTYLRRAFPEKPWISGLEGWTVIIGYIGTLSLYSFTFGAYGADLLGFPDSNFLRVFLSVFVLLFFYYINVRGVVTSGITEDIIVYGKILILSLFAAIGLSQIEWSRFYPPFNKGVPSVFLGAAVIFVAYEGFQLITNAVLETENPDKNIPRGIYGSIVITGTIYFLLSLIAVGVLTYDQIVSAKEYALAVVAQPILGDWGRLLIGFAALLATSSAINSTLFGASRMAAEMAEEGMMPGFLAKRNKKFIPVNSLALLTVSALLFTSLSGLTVIAEFSSVTFLLVSIGVSIANIKLRDLTKANVKTALTGLVLMVVTTLTILVYLALENRKELLSILLIYLITAVLFFVYYRTKKSGVLRSP
ncbi:Amino acid transporter [Balnearium lithotrophicum]|uniref:Amino acid transporter n=1 Tax=Balnearium lithotrophicum TaxID=223788 RepID=A0A521C8Q3_9BACT|nr:APC family permease [Balnearium lithotrophicum]SMO55745.1 Amino acid transporter [Balnearium lithotrophicum]